MKFLVRISKLHNHFFFVSNLAEWSPYCRKHYNEAWLRDHPLSATERAALKKVGNVLKKKDLSGVFASAKHPHDVWNIVGRALTSGDRAILQHSFEVLSPRFEKLWRRDEKNLMRVRSEIERSASLSKAVLDLLRVLYGVSRKTTAPEIFLLTSPISKRLVGGGSSLGKDRIELECSAVTKRNNPNGWLGRVVLHELIHTSFESTVRRKIETYVRSSSFKKIYMRTLKRGAVYRQTRSFTGVIKEMVAVSLLPEGYLAEKFFGARVLNNLMQRKAVRTKKTLEKNYYDLMLFSLWGLFGTAREYCDRRKPIDAEYLEAAVRNWESFERMNLSRFDPKQKARGTIPR